MNLGVSADENHILQQSTEHCSLYDDIWQLPKRGVKAPRRVQKQDLYENRNRYSVLAERPTTAENNPKRDQTYFSKSMPDLLNILKKETGAALSWLENNEMIANPEKFHALLLRNNQTNTSGEQIHKIIKSKETVKLLGVTLDYKLDFYPHISNLCKRLQHNQIFLKD